MLEEPMKTVGERHWTAGPIVVASKRLHDRFVAKFTAADAKPLTKLVGKEVGTAKVGGETVLYLGRNDETGIVPWGDRAVLVPHCKETSGHLMEDERAKALAQLDPYHLPDGAWKRVAELALDGTTVMFDVTSRDVNATDERAAALELGLSKGRYVVEMATGEADVKPFPSKVAKVAYRFVRVRPPDWVAPQVGAAKPPVVDEGPVVAAADVITRAKKLARAENDQVPFVIAARAAMPAWTGIDGDDYDRACEVSGVGEIAIGKRKALVVAEPGGMMFWPTKTGGLVVIWLGAESNAGCVAAALSIPDKEWKQEKATLVVTKGAEDHVIFDSAARGDSLRRNGKIGEESMPTASFRLSAGRYRIDSVWSWEAEVRVGKKIEDTMIAALRFTKR
jgi:hypothetical protein